MLSADGLTLRCDLASPSGTQTGRRADQALEAHGYSPDKLIATARTVAREHLTKTSSTLGDRHEDLVMHLVEEGCKAAVKYDPDRSSSTGRYSFSSYIYDVMERRLPDYYRKKAEGFGDKRKGLDGRVIALHDADPADLNDDALEQLFTADRLKGWQQAADRTGWPLEEWVTITLDRAARDLQEAA